MSALDTASEQEEGLNTQAALHQLLGCLEKGVDAVGVAQPRQARSESALS